VRDYTEILHGLAIALLEIRASNDSAGMSILADVFHHVPGLIARGREPGDILDDLLAIARRHDCEAIVAQFFKHARDPES